MIDIQEQTSSPEPTATGHETPYVGLRPYERHEQDIFFGRHQDAQFLTDKVLSTKLTLLYAQSGLGKSSLLRALVIPKLEEEEDARVIYFDAWSGETPTADLKCALVEMADSMGIPDAGAGAPTLAELVLLIASYDRRPLIVILDQFEELLTSHGQTLDPLRKELGKLVRSSNLDAHILISLREEFLAALEPFRQEILTLFESTYSLANLDEKGIREAIELPAQAYNTRYESELLDRLMTDLKEISQAQASMPASQESPQIDLPLVQLVCSELWEEAQQQEEKKDKKQNQPTAESVTSDVKIVITGKLYDRLGGARKIIDNYVLKVMPEGFYDKIFTAKLFKYLAPPSGLKQSYSVTDLAEISGLKADRIREELERLGKQRILRTRQFQKEERFELQHDAFIRIVAPWRDEALCRCKQLRLTAIGIAIFSLAVVIGLGWYFSERQQKQIAIYNNTEKPLQGCETAASEQLGGLDITQQQNKKTPCETAFDHATSYSLWSRQDPERFDDLKNLLIKYQKVQPPFYGIQNSGLEFMVQPQKDDWPLTLHYSFLRDLDWYLFTDTWRELAKFFAESWCIPVPQSLRFIKEPEFPRQLVSLEGPDKDTTPLELKIETHEDKAFINKKFLTFAGLEFFEYFQKEWQLVEEVQSADPFYLVPRWSLAVWKVSGNTAIDGNGLPAFLLALELQKHPGLLLSSDAVEMLLRRVGDHYPHTVSEARAARGEKLRQDLIEWVKLGHPLSNLPNILDALANYQEANSQQAAEIVEADQQKTSVILPFHLNGPWPPSKAKAIPEEFAPAMEGSAGRQTNPGRIHHAYLQASSWLPPVKGPIRIYIGKDLERVWFPTGDIPISFQEHLATLRDEFYRRFGFQLPGVKFKSYVWDPTLEPNAFRIVIAADTDSTPIKLNKEADFNQLLKALQSGAEYFRRDLLSPDLVYELIESLPPSLHDWLYQSYSLTDLKILTRLVIAPEVEEPYEKEENRENSSTTIIPEQTLRHFEWLMGSLTFWSLIEDPMDGARLAEDLRATQKERFYSPRNVPTTTPLAVSIGKGVQALDAQRPKEAKRIFQQAILMDRNTAIDTFLALYVEHLQSKITREIDQACANPTNSRLSTEVRLNLEDILSQNAVNGQKTERQLTLCLYADHSNTPAERRNSLTQTLISKFGTPDDWPANEATWFGNQILRTYDPTYDDQKLVSHAKRFLKSGLQRQNRQQNATSFEILNKICSQSGPQNWCRQVMVELAEQIPSGYFPLYVADILSQGEKAEDQNLALSLLDNAKKNIDSIKATKEEKEWCRQYIKISRARALKRLGELGDIQKLAEAERNFAELSNSPWFNFEAYSSMIEILQIQERYSEAETLIDSALKKWPQDSNFYLNRFWNNLAQVDVKKAASTAQSIIEKVGKPKDPDTLFYAALGQILTGSGQWELAGRKFLETDHEYVDYVNMMLYAKLAGRAKEDALQLLKQRWNKIDSSTWSARQKGGDPMVWREMLIGYFMGEVPGKEIFTVLEDEGTFKDSDLNNLPLPRIGMLCEAYFYDAMLAKADGNLDRMRSRLQDVITTGKKNYFEYKMASYMLNTDNEWLQPKKSEEKIHGQEQAE